MRIKTVLFMSLFVLNKDQQAMKGYREVLIYGGNLQTKNRTLQRMLIEIDHLVTNKIFIVNGV